MKKDELLSIMSERTGLEATKIAEIINSENEEIEGIELPQLHVFDENQLSERLKNHVDISKPTLIEMAIKDARNKLGLEFEGKTIENLAKAAIEKGKQEAGIKPNEALKEKDSIIEKLQKTIEDVENDYKTKLETKETELSQIRTNQNIYSLIPDNLDTNLSKKDLAILFKNDVQTVEQDGKLLYKQNGEVLRDAKTQNHLSGEAVINNWLSEKNIMAKQENKGRADGNSKTKTTNLDSITTSAEFYAYCDANNIPRSEHPEIMKKIRETNSNFFLT
ncbi:hypothetical protein RPMD05_74 [Rhodobacteraceae phage LS06-2018-MD05]|nr:hypothetical protein RPMD05_74 [Rhodobacteraceae phage LS06-2018-MD05]